jgi:hypothetical protein
VKQIPIQKTNLYAIVDDLDYDFLSLFKWYLRNGYPTRFEQKEYGKSDSIQISMHSDIMGSRIDHIDGNKLNNLRSNLRKATQKQNAKNVARHKDNSSGFKGVWRRSDHKRKKIWVAEITCDGKSLYLGSYLTPEEAHAVYDAKARELFGEFYRNS